MADYNLFGQTITNVNGFTFTDTNNTEHSFIESCASVKVEFDVVYSSSAGGATTVTCNKTFLEVNALLDNADYLAAINARTYGYTETSKYIAEMRQCSNNTISYVAMSLGVPIFEVFINSDNTCTYSSTPSSLTTLTATENGTYTPTDNRLYSEVTVSVAGSGGTDLLHETLNRTISGTVYDSTATGIPSYFFQSCYSLGGANFPAVRVVSQYAFAYCYSLTTVSFPSASDIMGNAFTRCSSLTAASFPLVSYIGSGAFQGCSNLSTIYFPSATSIGSVAFSYCNSLTEASFPIARSIGQSAFYYCPNITTVSFPSATYIGGTAFANCYGLTTVSFSKVTSLGNQVFYGCNNLTTADFPVLTSIGNAMFQSCTNLTTVNFPIATSIGTSAFQSCTHLSTAYFPIVTHIGGSAFQYCSSLTVASFPAVVVISTYAFRSCAVLKSAYFLTSTVPTVSSTVFIRTPLSDSSYLGYFGSIYVKESLLASFQTALYWSAYSARMVGLTDAQIEAL